MKKIKKYPKVLLVGRTNVGKSTLFNRLSEKEKSIVLQKENVTRDYMHETIEWQDKKFDLIDTGGLNLKKNQDSIFTGVQEKILNILPKAKLIFFVCDVKSGLTIQDRQIGKLLHKSKVPTIVLLNKSDNQNAAQENSYEFYNLGFKKMISVSAIHGLGIRKVLDTIAEIVPNEIEEYEESPTYNVTIIGKPNVGKSSLTNILLKKNRTIVSQIAGTTREAICEPIYHCNDLITITDTAGIRRKSKIDDSLELLMAKSSLNAVKQSDIIALMVDASELKLSHQELRLLDYAYKQKKSIIIIFNKMDLLDQENKKILNHNLDKYDFLLKKLSRVNISCKSKKNISKLFDEFEKAWQRRIQKFDTTTIDEMVKEYLATKPLYHKRTKLKLFKIRHVPGKIPTFVLHLNYPEWFGESQLGFIENILRKHYDLQGCPIVFSKRKV